MLSRLGFRTKLIVGTVSLVVGFVAFASLALNALIGRAADVQIERDLSAGHRSYVNYMTVKWQSLRDNAEFLAQSRLIAIASTNDRATVEDELSRLDMAAMLSFVVVADSDGQVLGTTPAAPQFSPDLGRARGMTEALGGSVAEGLWRVGDDLFLIAAAPLVQRGGLVGTVVVGEPLDSTAARGLAEVTGRDALLVHGDLVVAASWRDGTSVDLTVAERSALVDHPAVRTPHAEGSPMELLLGGRRRSALATPLRTAGDPGVLVLAQDLEEVMELHRAASFWLLVCGLGIGALGVLTSLRLAGRLARPLRALMRAADSMTRGDLSTRVQVDSTDEIGRLSHSFNRMAHTIEKLVDDVCEQAHRAEAANRAKDAFLTSASHELRTPLSGIKAATEILSSLGADGLESDRQEFLKILETETERLSRLIAEVLDFAMIESGQLNWHVADLDLRETVEQAVAALRERRVDVAAVTVSGDIELPFRGDRERLILVVEHLIHNACTHAPRSGDISVEVRADAVAAHIRVADRGPGIPDGDDKTRVFDRFYQCGDTLTGKPPGAGLGLTISQVIAQAHAGAIVCEDNDGGGAVFTLSLPLDMAPGSRPIDAPAERSEEDRRGSALHSLASGSGIRPAVPT